LEEAVGRPIHESFDYICGVSTGAVLAIMIGARKKRVEEVEVLYRKISQDVFRQDRSSGLGGLLWNHSYYNSEKWEKILQEHIGL
jgi:calcium-independent phospholipase A2-gamma